GDFAAASARGCQPEQLGEGMAGPAIKQDRAVVGGKLGERLAAGDVMGPSANARWRSALMLEMAHMEFLPRNISAFQHSQHCRQGVDLHLCEPELLCGLEVLCQHVVLPLTSLVIICAHTTGVNLCLEMRLSSTRRDVRGVTGATCGVVRA